MSEVRVFLANPYKIEALSRRFLRPVLRKRARKRLDSVRIENLSQFLRNGTGTAAHFRNRHSPVFFFDDRRLPDIIGQVSNEEKSRTVGLADEILRGVFTFRNAPPVLFADGIDWTHVPFGNRDWNVDLNRLDFLVAVLMAAHYTGAGSYGEYASRVLSDWVARNGAGSPPWDDPFEAAQRINTLSWVLFVGRSLSDFADRGVLAAVAALLRSGCWIEATLEYHVPNNHLLIEALRLAQLGLLYPEFERAGKWLHDGLNLLGKEIQRQVLPDGVHAERSVFYQRLVFESLLEIVALLRRNGAFVPNPFEDAARRMFLFLRAVRRPDGRYPLLGDGFQSDVLLRYDAVQAGAALLEAGDSPGRADERSRWFLNGLEFEKSGKEKKRERSFATTWKDGGYAVFRRVEKGVDSALLFDFGKFGLEAAPGHGHCDCLSMELTVAARPFLVDAGSHSWGRDAPYRNAFRGTSAHNTIAIDRREQTLLYGTFGAGRFAAPVLKRAVTAPVLRLAEASHDGYARLREPVIHSRAVIETAADGWLVVDRLSGRGRHFIEVFWHFHPDISVTSEPASFVASDGDAVRVRGLYISSRPMEARVVRGGGSPPIGWISPDSGVMAPADTLVVSAEMTVPAWIATVFSPVGGASADMRLELLPCDSGLAFVFETSTSRTTAFFADNDFPGGSFGEWRTNASVAVFREGKRPGVLLAGGSWIEGPGGKCLRLPGTATGGVIEPGVDGLGCPGVADQPRGHLPTV